MQPRKTAIQLASLAAACMVFVFACRKPDAFESESEEWFSGGAQTVFDQGSGAFGHAFTNMSHDKAFLHEVGDVGFNATFVTAPSQLNPGLGPVFNSVSCGSCHIADGRGKPPGPGEQLISMLFRISVPGTDAHGGPNPVPGFGGQLQPRAIFGKDPEGNVDITYTYETRSFPDGETYELRVPNYTIINTYMPMPSGVMLSPRIAPPVFGLGLLEAVAEADILASVDVNDANGDGISGKANRVWDVPLQQFRLGRFGWKAGQPTLLQQSAGAYSEDMGISNPLFPKESTYGQTQYVGFENDPGVSDSILHAVAFYVRSLAVPARRNVDDAEVVKGKLLFSQLNCSGCHTPTMRTATNIVFPEISNLKIFPYSDMLLHDMGAGLADNRPEFDANGLEWRTTPLWGLGLTQTVNGHNYFLHDGRARNLTEAIMWHGGEAQQSINKYSQLPKADRDAILKFLGSL